MALSMIRVSFSKQANDGDYGSETARCELEYTLGDGDLNPAGTDLPAELLISARAYVHAELSKSPNWKVRHAVQEPEHAEALQLAEDDREDLPY
jgi:hypothetical protein